ncbi:MAG: S8 family serine peptidase, partial [Bacteroidales bacterium]|nr:S8 family serine peptidase [Bacteroidales bacterium]
TNAQSPAKYWVQFKDKSGTPYAIDRPQEFLSPRAIELREKHHIAIQENDLPVNPAYVRQVLALDSSMRLFTRSKWLNGITIYCEKDSILNEILQLPFVAYAERTIPMKEPEGDAMEPYRFDAAAPVVLSEMEGLLDQNELDYGNTKEQIQLNNAHWLHRMGFHGERMQLMILDGGFINADTLHYFQKLRDDNRLLGVRNLVTADENPFRKHTHGTMVLSCIASYVPGELVGTAPMVQVFLCQTEDSRSENKIEEDNWVAGVELADSLGCQMLNSSLGYIKFDDSTQVRVYADMNGEKSRAAQAATIAASKGMLICNAAGNSGDEAWKYMGSPADARDILTVGAVDVQGTKAPFSSFGPTADGRVKPDACAVGYATYLASVRGKSIRSFGTSFASPVLCGMVACLWQAFPDKSNYEIMDAVRQSGNQFAKPDSALGYGIPDFLKAYNILKQPQPASFTVDFDSFEVDENGTVSVEISDPNATFIIKGEKGDIQPKIQKLHFTIDDVESDIVKYVIQFPKADKKKMYELYELEVKCQNETLRYTIGREK